MCSKFKFHYFFTFVVILIPLPRTSTFFWVRGLILFYNIPLFPTNCVPLQCADVSSIHPVFGNMPTLLQPIDMNLLDGPHLRLPSSGAYIDNVRPFLRSIRLTWPTKSIWAWLFAPHIILIYSIYSKMPANNLYDNIHVCSKFKMYWVIF